MSEFKFACPVCGQHITADSSTGGGQIECPTCFQKIVVPQAPASAETKFILSAAQVGKPRPVPAEAAANSAPPPPVRSRLSLPAMIAWIAVLCVAGTAAFVFRDKLLKLVRHQETAKAKPPAKKGGKRPPRPATVYPVPTNIVWSLDLANAALPETPAAGRIHGSGFHCERATLENGTFSLRQGPGWPPDLGVTILLPPRPNEEFAGKTFEVAPSQLPPTVRVVLRWKDEQQQPAREDFPAGNAMKLAFGQAANGRLPGKIYLCLPDPAKSFVAGTFDAELRKPRPSQPKGPKPKG